MDYPEVDSIFLRHGLAQEPAFDKVGIAIRPIPDMEGCPLGLYYPDSALVVIPPDGYESVLLHELGHRYGHFYYENLSEDFAEDWRSSHQGESRVLFYSGGDFARLNKMGKLYKEGQHGEIQVAFNLPVSFHDISTIMSNMQRESGGEALPEVHYIGKDPSVLGFSFTKGIDWPNIINLSLTAVTALGVIALGYAIYKTAKESPWVIPLVLFGTVAGVVLLSKRLGGGYVA